MIHVGRYYLCIRDELQELALVVEGLLKCSLRLGPVIIVTNSKQGWVEYSAQTYFPSLSRVSRAAWV